MRIETSSIETGSSAMISFGLAASAAAKPTRWRWPPLSSYGNFPATRPAGTSPTVPSVFSTSWPRVRRGTSRRWRTIPRSIGCVTR
jgi:hypothetical protein